MTERLKRIRQEITGVVSILGGIYLVLSLATYSKWDPSLFVFTTFPMTNYGGIVGSYIADLIVSGVGFPGFVLPVALCIYGLKRLIGKEGHKIYIIGLILFILSSSMLATLITTTFNLSLVNRAGGIVGGTLSDFLLKMLSIPGAYIFSLAVFLSAIIILSPVSLVSFIMERQEKKVEEERDEEVGDFNEEPIIIGEYPDVLDLDKVNEAATSHVLTVKDQRVMQRTEKRMIPESVSSLNIGEYKLPDIEFLALPSSVSSRPAREELIASSSLLEKKLKDYDVEGKVIQVHPGPVVTMYEFEPAPGVKINRVVSLSDDLALSMRAQSVRVSTLSGKAAIGIEVPNKNREQVCLREIISSEYFARSSSRLTLALGKDIFGNPVVADLSKMPHLLVAGATGSGKSVSINSMVMSILYKASPREVKMLMIDPKLLELSSYENIPHLISPVITGPKEAAEALKKMVFEMESRYRLLAEKGVRNIEGFNRVAPAEEQLPYIVVFIDELADLMFASASEVEDSIARLAQMARASGIHLILATQRPSVDVITGIIKANFPARIAFQVTSRIDSRTIIDTQGAEQLLGRGDMLLLLPGTRIVRIHGALVTEEDIRVAVDFVRSQGRPDYSLFESIQVEEAALDDQSGDRDEMYQKVIDFAESIGEVSISSIQRRFKIGYNRAAKIMELMEDDGFVGPQRGAGKPRDFLRRR